MSQPFYGYPGQVWAVVLASLGYLNQALGTTTQPFNTLSLAETVVSTALNGLSAINAQRNAGVMQGALIIMQQIESLPILLDPTDVFYFTNRLNSFASAASGLAALVPSFPLNKVGSTLSTGQPAIPYPGVLEYYNGFDVEPPPVGLTNLNLPFYAAQSGQAFTDIAAALATIPGLTKSYIYDLPNQLANENNAYAQFVSGFPFGFASDVAPQELWNQMFVLPTMLMHADMISGAPSTVAAQQDMLIRYLIITIIQQVQLFIMTTSRPAAAEAAQARVMVSDSLMDIANRNLGDFEQWKNIAAINNLSPPYIASQASPASGIAGWGQQIQLPTPGGTPQPGVAPNYARNFLGVDLYFGPLNGDMPPWAGDFQVIAGYDNLLWALGRRLQTTIGTLIYHNGYGCRIPPEIGQVQTLQTAGYIAEFGKSCLQSDPRVATVQNATATLSAPETISFVASVLPGGFGSTPIQVNEVINSAVTPSSVGQG